MDEILMRIVQIGTVTAIDNKSSKARVKFQDTGITSDWLCVLQHSVTAEWMPHINDIVVVLYLPIFNSDGFVIGRIGGV